MVQCAELGDISGPLHSGGGECRHAYWLPFRNHHFSRIDSTSHSTAGRVQCLCRGFGGRGEEGGDGGMCGQLHQGKSEQHTQPRWMIACCVRRSASHLFRDAVSEEDQWVDAVLKWRLQLQATYWWSHRTSSAVRYFVFWDFASQTDSQTCRVTSEALQPMQLALKKT